MDAPDDTKPLSQSATIWGAISVLVAVILKGVLHLDDKEAQQVADAVLTILSVVGPVVIIYGRYRLQKRLNAAVLASTPMQNPMVGSNWGTPPIQSAVSNPAAASTPSNPAAGL